MPRQTPFTLAMNKAHASLLRGFDLALDRTGRVPLGHDIIDKRTHEREMGFPMTSAPMDSKPIQSRPAKQQAPLPPDTGQSLKNRLGGKVVDPTAIETAQSADGLSVDTSSGYSGEY